MSCMLHYSITKKAHKIFVGDARQQCCYGSNGNVLPPGHSGAGTPDRAADYTRHQELDVDPYEWCCSDCGEPGYCDWYINEVRKGDTSHCP